MIPIVLVVWRLLSPRESMLLGRLKRLSPSVALARISAVTLVPLYALQLALLATESRLQSGDGRLAWMKTLPIPVYNYREDSMYRVLFSELRLGIAVLETAAIAIVVLTLRHNHKAISGWAGGTLAVMFAALSLGAPVMSTADPYEYVATGILGLQSYAPPSGAFVGTAYESLQKLVPLHGVIYGPLWVLCDVAQTHLGSSIYQKIEAIRVTNVAFIGVFCSLLVRSGLSRASLAGFALNPCVWFFVVANPHADIQGLTALIGAYALARRSKTWPAVLCVVAAGLIKLPFVIVGVAALAPLRGVPRRIGACCASMALVVLLSYAMAGPAYFFALTGFTARRASINLYPGWVAIAVLIVIASVVLVVFRRGVFGTAWLFQQMTLGSLPWYLFWGIPYAIATGTFDVYAVTLPLAASLLDEGGVVTNAFQCGFILLFVVLMADAYLSRRRPSATAVAAA